MRKNMILLATYKVCLALYLFSAFGLESSARWPRAICLVTGAWLILFLMANKDAII